MTKLCKSTGMAVLLVLLTNATAFAGGEGWMTDFEAAQAKAAEKGKPMLLDFTGSDWCGWCIRLDKETFSKPEFQKFAKDNLVLVELDFPNNKPQSAEIKKQNEALQEKYGVQGFPTLVLLNSEGKEIARNPGYLPGGPSALIAWVEAAKAKK